MAQAGISGRTLGVIVTVFTIINLFGGSFVRPYLESREHQSKQDTEIKLIEQRQTNIEKQIEELKNDNKADHNSIQGKLSVIQNDLSGVISDMKHLLRSSEKSKSTSVAAYPFAQSDIP